MIKKLFYIKVIFVTVLMLMVVAPAVMADQVKLVGDSGYGPYQTGRGGEFTFKVLDPNLNWILSSYVPGKTSDVVGGTNLHNFQTFCVEGGEYISANGTYDVTISPNAIRGGVSGTGGDPISQGTAYLYHQFQLGILEGYNYTGTESQREASADELQKAIWWLEREGIRYDPDNPYMYAVKELFDNPSTYKNEAKDPNDGQYPVMVLNLWTVGHSNDFSKDGHGNYLYLHQDQLVCAPIPEPATMILLGSGLLALAGLARRRFKK